MLKSEIEGIKELIYNKEDVNAQDDVSENIKRTCTIFNFFDKIKPLHQAIVNKDVKRVEVLLLSGSNIEQKDQVR